MTIISEKLPHIQRKIDVMWGTQSCRDYLMTLVSDNRDGQRKGFSMDLINEIIAVLDKHDVDFPQFNNTNPIDAWRYTKPSYVKVQDESSGLPWYINIILWLACLVIVVKLVMNYY